VVVVVVGTPDTADNSEDTCPVGSVDSMAAVVRDQVGSSVEDIEAETSVADTEVVHSMAVADHCSPVAFR